MRGRPGLHGAVAAVLLAGLLPAVRPAWAQAPALPDTPAAACRPDPLGGRGLYLRGSFNSWNAVESQRLGWACNRWQLVTRLQGEHRFKLGDEGWSADADFGLAAGSRAAAPRIPLALRGQDIERRFDGVHRFTVQMSAANVPELQIDTCPAPAPLGNVQLFLRGTLNNWAALDGYVFQYSCDAYYLNLQATGRHEFKVADAGWSDAATFGSSADNKASYVAEFNGEHTVRLAIVAGRAQLSVGPRSFADPRAQPVTDPVALSLRFDSRSAAHKRPFGAVPVGTAIDFAVSALPGVEQLTLVVERRRLEGNQELLEYTEQARVPMRRDAPAGGGPAREHFHARHVFGETAVFGYWFEARIGGRVFALQNNAEPVFWTREKGSGGGAAVAERPQAQASIRRFRQTVFDPAFTVPDWAADAVYYQIFPDRFRNGDPGNDPRPGLTRYRNVGVEVHRRWTERPFKPGSGDGSDAHFNNDFFGGDLAGIVEKLDELRDLGVNALYLTPVFQAGSNHKYDTADYTRIDPAFGSNADFERLTREAARRGIRVIPDTSLNHTGSDSLYFNRYGNFPGTGAFQNGRIARHSPYADWYSFKPGEADPERQYRGWVGVTDLPELNKASPGLRDFFYRQPGSVMRQWLDRGAAGWRMDVAPWVPDDFWREWRAAIKAHRPDAITIAETWFDASKYFLGDMFDSTMNYIFRNVVLAYANGGDARELIGNIELMREAYPPQALHALMNLLSSHDQARALHHFGWHDAPGDPPASAATIALAKRRLLLATFWQMTFPGAPSIYYGDEVGVTGGDDPDNRRTYPWPDLGGRPDLQLRAEFKRLIALRQAHPVLRRGSLEAPLFIDAQVIVWLRRLGSSVALVALNNAAEERSVTLELPDDLAGVRLQDALDGSDARPGPGRVLTMRLPAVGGRVWISR